MSQKNRLFTREFILQVVREVEAGKSIAQAACEHQVHPTLIGKWPSHNSKYGERALAGNGNTYKDEVRIPDLERMVGRLTMENALLKKALSQLETRSRSVVASGGK